MEYLKFQSQMLHHIVDPRALPLSLAHWLRAAPTLPDFDLRRFEFDINAMIGSTRCDCDVNFNLLFFLTFSISYCLDDEVFFLPFYCFPMTVSCGFL
jgi:hypothetical protein